MADVLFKGGKVQIGDRIKIPKAIVDTLKLSPGTKILIKFNSNNGRLIIETDKNKVKK